MLIWIGAAQTQEETLLTDQAGDPELTIEVSKTQVTLRGSVSSVAHESILRQRVHTLFPEKTTSFDLRERPALPPGWALVSELALRATAETYSSTIVINASLIQTRGIVGDAARWRESLSRVERNLVKGMEIDDQVIEIRSIGSLDRHCLSLFRTALRGRKIEFPRAGTKLSSSAYPLLDELIQIAADCPASGIVITGHTDNTGEETSNLELSQSRADAVAAYIIASGIVSERISATGVGSSRPLVDEATAQAHKLNRRIDIELVFP